MIKKRRKYRNKQYPIDLDQIYRLSKKSEGGINIHYISHSAVTIHSERYSHINVGAIIQSVDKLDIPATTKKRIIESINGIKSGAENKVPWEKIVEQITVLLSLGKEVVPLVLNLLKWIAENI